MQKIANMQGWLSVAIGNIKFAITKSARENNLEFAWQT
jgi:arginyl-tRNA synthetase